MCIDQNGFVGSRKRADYYDSNMLLIVKHVST